ncbi:MAG TPA: ABC transporter substrate-binding protein, partial [Sphingomonadales bacterium]|nr:ABC transporter substrate-binding protein [Sphingomonadales bacterium]
LALADDEQILALSPDARGPFSYFGARAAKFPRHREEADEILLLHPDLAVATGAGLGLASGALQRLGLNVFSTGLAPTLERAIADLVEVGEKLGHREKADALANKARALKEKLLEENGVHVPGLYLSPGGITTGAGTFLDEILALGGIENVVAAQGVTGWSQFDLEAFVAERPQVVVTSFFDSRVGHQESWRFAGHPAVRAVLAEADVIEVPSRLLSCPAWFAVEGAVFIRERLKGKDAL